MKKFFFLAIVLACMAAIAESALSASQESLLKQYDSMALNDIWRVMTYYTFYKYIASFVCSSTYANYLADAAGLFTAADVEAAYDVPTLCLEGFTKVYSAVWYRYDDKVYTYGNDDLFNYTP